MAGGERTENHPGRQVGKERWIPNYDANFQAEEDADAPSEPDYEGIVRRRQERRRPDWA